MPAALSNGETMPEHRHQKGDGSWWANDAQGIPLRRVCDECVGELRKHYRPEVLDGYSQADMDEPIEPDEPCDLTDEGF